MKTAIVYCSRHHGNTKKLLDAIAQKHDVTLIDAVERPNAELSGYELIGFASGIYYSSFHKSVLQLAEKRLPKGAKVFLMYTCGAKKGSYTRKLRELVEARGGRVIGEYGCLGYDTFGPFKLIGGIAKGHPDGEELCGAVDFFENLKA